MATIISDLVPLIRQRLIEPSAVFWTDDELIQIAILGIRDLWRSTCDLKQEHFLKIDNEHVVMPANSFVLTGVPDDVHKVYIIEPRDITETSTNHGVVFEPRDYNNKFFQQARAMPGIDPTTATIYYSIHQQGAPVNSPEIRVAPKINSDMNISFAYVPVLGVLAGTDRVPIPGEADNAIIAWTVAFARAKEREDRSPDPAWLTIYATEKQSILQGLGVRQYQEPSYVEAQFEEYWSG